MPKTARRSGRLVQQTPGPFRISRGQYGKSRAKWSKETRYRYCGQRDTFFAFSGDSATLKDILAVDARYIPYERAEIPVAHFADRMKRAGLQWFLPKPLQGRLLGFKSVLFLVGEVHT